MAGRVASNLFERAFAANASLRLAGFLVMAFALLGACSTPPMNAPFVASGATTTAAAAAAVPYEFSYLEPHGSDEALVLLAFSGGGKRSAAFAYGALTALKDTGISLGGEAHSLLSEVDVISSVSGGSFPAAYYALHRDRIFTDFEKDFLRKDIEAYVYGVYLLPWHWEWMVNPVWGTNDTMMRVYDSLMFHGATYGDLVENGRPLVVIGATDIGLGGVFGFT